MKQQKKVMIIAILITVLLSACSKGGRWQKQYDLGMQYLTEGNYEEAIVAFNTAIEIEPNQAMAYVGRGNAYIGSGETAENLALALGDYQQALKLNGKNVDAYLGIADVYIRQGDFDTALAILNDGLEKTGGDELIADKISEIESGNILDSSGSTRRKSSYDNAGNLLWYHDFTYNPNGTTASVTSYDSSGNQTGHVDLVNDDDLRNDDDLENGDDLVNVDDLENGDDLVNDDHL